MTTITTPSSLALVPSLETAWQDVDSSFERFCLTAGIGAIEQMLCEDAQQLAGTPHNRGGARAGDLDGGTGRGLAWPLGHEPDADQRVDAQAPACRAAARGRSAGHCWRRHLEVGGLAGSWHCRQNGWPSGWRLTCPSWTCWSSRSTGCTSATTWCWSLPSALMEKATNIRSP